MMKGKLANPCSCIYRYIDIFKTILQSETYINRLKSEFKNRGHPT